MTEVSRVKRYQFQHFFLTKLEKMKEVKFQQNILQPTKIDTATNFMANGDINIYPCAWEEGKSVTNGKRVRYRGGIEVDDDGRTRVKRWNVGMNGPKYQTIFETAHGSVKVTRKWKEPRPSQECVTINFKFQKKYGVALIRSLLAEEFDEVMSFMKTRKEETIWSR